MYLPHDDWRWSADKKRHQFHTVDLHTEGEPLRVITKGLPELKGNTLLEKREDFIRNYDFIRKLIILEPRGHADMYGAIMLEPINSDADFAVFFLHNEGYSTMCGHGIIALTKFVLDTSIFHKRGERVKLKIDTPAGRVVSEAIIKRGKVEKVYFCNVPSFVYKANRNIFIEDFGVVKYDIVFGGAFYAIIDSGQLSLGLSSKDYFSIVETGIKLKEAIVNVDEIRHPYIKELSFLYGVIFTGKALEEGHHSRNVCVFANGEIDRSPTGTGVSARVALLFSRGEIEKNQRIIIESILGTTFSVEIQDDIVYGPYQAVVPVVGGSSSIIGDSRFYLDSEDNIQEGFIFR
ncbi:MAG: proline racemase family protein [Bacteroidales bacterium]